MIQMDKEEHARNRGLISVAFRAKVINQFAETEIIPIVEDLLAGLAGRRQVDLNGCSVKGAVPQYRSTARPADRQ